MKKVLKFSASWCGPCKMLSNILSNVQTDVVIEEVDIEKDVDLARQYQIRGVPTLVMFENNAEIKRVVGLKDKTELENWLNN